MPVVVLSASTSASCCINLASYTTPPPAFDNFALLGVKNVNICINNIPPSDRCDIKIAGVLLVRSIIELPDHLLRSGCQYLCESRGRRPTIPVALASDLRHLRTVPGWDCGRSYRGRKSHHPQPDCVAHTFPLPTGCRFHTRCWLAQDICKQQVPEWRNVAQEGVREHWVACHFAPFTRIPTPAEVGSTAATVKVIAAHGKSTSEAG